MTACTACWWYTHAHKPGCPGEAEVPPAATTGGGPRDGVTSQEVGAMPKEYIHSMDHGRRVTFDGSTEERVVDYDAVKVGWAKDRPGVDMAVVDLEKDPDGFEAQYINLDRAGCNRLITTLRRARDGAFGKDA